MDQPKRRKEDMSVDLISEEGGFSQMKMSADEIRGNLKNPEIISMIKHYFILNKDENNVANYISAGGSVAEISELLSNMDLSKRDQTCVIFEALRLIILKTATQRSDQQHLIRDCKQLISSYIGEFQSILTTKTSVKNKKIILRLLASVAALDITLASLILLSLSLTKDDVDMLVEHSDPCDTECLRIAFIHFLLAFIIEQNQKVIEKLLAKKVWLPSIFPGLKYDNAFILKLVLSTLEGKVVDNKDLSKTNKLHVFGNMSLKYLEQLYNWNPKTWYYKKENRSFTFTGQISEDDKIEIRNLVHGLLLKICTSVKYGIAFHDPTYGASGIQRNYTISNFLLKIDRPWEDDLKSDLLIKVISVIPDLLKPILPSFQPRLKRSESNWFEVFKFIAKIMADLKFDFTNLDPKFIPLIVNDLVVPSGVVESIGNENLMLLPDPQQRVEVLKLLCVLFNKCNDIFSHYLNNCEGSSSIKYEITSSLFCKLPKMSILKDCIQMCYRDDYQGLKEIVDLCTLCVTVCPEIIIAIKYDFDLVDLIRRDHIYFYETGIRKDIPALLNMIRLELVVNPQDVSKDETLQLFKYTTAGKKEEDIKTGISILKEFMQRSGLFIYNEKELLLWVYCMENHFNNDIGSILASSLKWAFQNMNDIYKTILAVQENFSDDGPCGLNLDDFLRLSFNDDVQGLGTSENTVLNLSPLLPSILQFLSDENCKENDDFVVAFIVHYLHQQVTLQPYIEFLKNYKCAAVERIMIYIESWLEQPIYLSIPPFNKSVFYYASKSIIGGKKFGYEMAKETVEDIRVMQLLLEECIFMACELSRLRLATPARMEQISSLVKLCITKSGLQVPLYHPTLLDNFHPLSDVDNSDLTDLIVMIAEESRLPLSSLAPFSQRLAFELKYAKKVCYSLDDDSKLKKLFQIFKFSKSDVENLISYVFSMKTKYFERNGKLSFWASMIIFLLNQAMEHKILISGDDLKNLIKIIIKLIEKDHDTSSISEIFLNYLNELEVDICSDQLDSLKELFVALSTANIWHENFCIYIHRLLDDVDYTYIPIQRSVTLLASLEKIKKKHKEILSNCYMIIFNGLCERPSPKWLVDLKKLIGSALSVETCIKTSKHIRKHANEVFPSVESLSVIIDIFKKSDEVEILLTIVTDWLYEEFKKSESFDHIQCEEMSKILSEILKSGIDLSGLDPIDNELISSLLSEGLKLPSHHFLDLLLCCIEQKKTKPPPAEIFKQLTSHFGFHDVLLGKNISAKNSCLYLFLRLIGTDNSLINPEFIPVLLASYQATLSKTDQIIFKILYIYEKVGGINLIDWKPFVWGELALEHYSAKSKHSNAKPNPYVTLDLFEKDAVMRTINDYPLHRQLNGDYEKDEDSIYDPAFYLIVLAQVTSEKNLGWKLANCGALALTLSALASSDSEIRAAAYHVLQKITLNIDDHNDNLIWKHFINALRGGIADLEASGNIRLSSIVTLFLARASIAMVYPDDPLYYSLHNFIFAKPHLKLNSVPAFLEMFHHTKGSQKLHQCWILEVLRDGIREQRDLQLALNCFTFKLILDYHSCYLATPKMKQLIEDIVSKCIKSIDEKQLLINNYSIISWISGANCDLINDLPQKINSQYKPLIDFVKQRSIKI